MRRGSLTLLGDDHLLRGGLEDSVQRLELIRVQQSVVDGSVTSKVLNVDSQQPQGVRRCASDSACERKRVNRTSTAQQKQQQAKDQP